MKCLLLSLENYPVLGSVETDVSKFSLARYPPDEEPQVCPRELNLKMNRQTVPQDQGIDGSFLAQVTFHPEEV